ncbi:MAG: hypothetical protein IJA02_03725 [Clostridia bacterium]|nr:hypothetical protein [Clostridia bacterium]
MKRVISIILCTVLVFCTVAPCVTANQENIPSFDWDGNPIIFIQGYSGPILIRDRGLETEEQIWGINAKDLIKKLASNLPGLISGLAKYHNGDTEPFVEKFREFSAELVDDISMMPDGSSKYNVVSYPTYVEEASVKYINEEKDGDYLPMTEGELIEAMAQTVPEDKIFIFNTDWRRSQIVNCEHLDEFIDSVLKYTGAKQVDIYALSHGGQLTATYLYYHGTNGKIDNVVMNSPAVRGTSLLMELLGDKPINFNLKELLHFGGVMLGTELDIRWATELLPAEFLNSLVKTVFNEVLLPHAIYFGSAWDFMDIETYTALRDVYLDPIENAAIIERADKMHFDCMANIDKGLKAAQAAGVNISIIAGYGTQMGTGKMVDSDYIIDTVSTTGAAAAPYGTTFAQKPKIYGGCTNEAHNHMSPTQAVDASGAYLPENTWFVYGLCHTQAKWDKYVLPLILELLLTDNIKDVHTDERYPQFDLSQCPLDGVYAKFTDSPSGTFTQDSTTLLIRNLSDNHKLTITAVTLNGEPLRTGEIIIDSGEEATVPCIPASDGKPQEITITFQRRGGFLSNEYSRTIYFSAA